MKINYLDAQRTDFHFKCNNCKNFIIVFSFEQFFNSDRETLTSNFFNCFNSSTNIHATPPTFGSWNTAKAINKFKRSVAESVEV